MLIDCHVHLPSPEVSKGHSAEGNFQNVAEAADCLKKCGIDGIIFNMWRGVYADSGEDVEIANEQALRLFEADPGFHYPGLVIHPRFPDVSEKWLERFWRRGLMWVGELVDYRCRVDFGRPEWMRLLEKCRKNGQIVQLHGGLGVMEVARARPDLKIVCSHIFPELLQDLAAFPNLWLDLSGSESGPRIGRMEMALKYFGPDRLLWGTDFQVFDPEVFIVRAKNAFPDPDLQAKVFSGNLLRLLASAGSAPAFQKSAG